MSEEELPKRTQEARHKPQTAALGSATGRPGPSETCLMRRTDAYSAFSSRDLGNPGFIR